MSGRFGGRVALVTGAASGIGRATATAFAAEGARVVVTDVDGAAADGVARGLGGALAVALDVADEAAWAAAVERARAWAGRLDVLVNNAGVVTAGPLAELDLPAWRRTFAVNVDGAALGLRAALPLLREARGCAVNVASASGRKAQPGAAAYCASKAALLVLSRVAARELAPLGVRVNCVLPGGVKTPLWDRMTFFQDLVKEQGGREAAFAALAADTPLGGFSAPEDVARAILFLASDEAATITGAELAVDGGYLA